MEATQAEFESEIPKEKLQQKIVSLQGFKDFYQLPHLMEECELYLSSNSCDHQVQMIQIIAGMNTYESSFRELALMIQSEKDLAAFFQLVDHYKSELEKLKSMAS